MPGRDVRTRWQGVFARHQDGCDVERLPPKPSLTEVAKACDCTPSYYGKVYVDFPRFRGHLSAWVEGPGQGGSSAQIEAAVSTGVSS